MPFHQQYLELAPGAYTPKIPIMESLRQIGPAFDTGPGADELFSLSAVPRLASSPGRSAKQYLGGPWNSGL